MSDDKKDSYWKRISHKRRISVVDEDTLTEIWHLRLSRMGAFIVLTLMFVLTMVLFSVLIIYTPIRHMLPGYSENIRQQLIEESMRVDSLNASMELQTRYLDVVKQVVAGEITSEDTIQSLDSMQIIMQEELLAAQNEATAEFVAQYEANEKDNLQLFDQPIVQPSTTLFLPAHGVLVQKYHPEDGMFGVLIQTPEDENVISVLSGTLVQCSLEINNTYTMIIQHTTYLSVYRNVGKSLKSVGSVLQAGESIGLASNEQPLYFELWQSGRSINPEDVIVF